MKVALRSAQSQRAINLSCSSLAARTEVGPSDQLLFAVDLLRAFADRALKDNPTLKKPLSTLFKYAVPALGASNLLKCKEMDDIHRAKLMELISVRFLRPLLVNYEFNVSDKHDAFKYFARSPCPGNMQNCECLEAIENRGAHVPSFFKMHSYRIKCVHFAEYRAAMHVKSTLKIYAHHVQACGCVRTQHLKGLD